MGLSIKNEATEELARKVAAETGESITEAIRKSLEERHERLARAKSGRSLKDEIDAIALRCASLPIISDLSEDEILGYDEFGIPSR